ncbi:hypothetical protein LZD49_26750 [Dyadobacter sp. CY261]|uniref:hypothetical protein n=1 Tax=Dyadobacter sp. CY261 TaxID=2907203 RepID=UPI001F1B8815|nr:hypothetical protein [Dyadobacter sp. CY261]MCF0074111.1 hypothetical protein [Dyadobacter sp. CY261]
MKALISLVIFVFLSYLTKGQENTGKFQKLNSIQLELSGREEFLIPFSLHYERIIAQNAAIAWTIKAGGTYQPIGSSIQKAAILESGIMGQGEKHHWEVGLTGMLQDKKRSTMPGEAFSGKATSWYSAVRIGYRYQAADSRWIVRIGGLIPVAYDAENVDWSKSYKLRNVLFPWPAISIGRSF